MNPSAYKYRDPHPALPEYGVGGAPGHRPTCPRSQYAQAGRHGEKCCEEEAPLPDPLVEALRASLERR
jgi:hypothetical protein